MLWEDNSNVAVFTVPDAVQEIVFRIRCDALPVDHAWELYDGFTRKLSWIDQEPSLGILSIHVASSGNGWTRPLEPDAMLELSRRTRMIVRVPKSRIDETLRLSGETFTVGEHELKILEGKARTLTTGKTLFARAVICEGDEQEETFFQRIVTEIRNMDIPVTKMMCGLPSAIRTPQKIYQTRSVLVSDLEPKHSITLQQMGVGTGRHLGCGIFVPHKSLAAVGESQDD